MDNPRWTPEATLTSEWVKAILFIVAVLVIMGAAILWLAVPLVFTCGCTQPPPS